jgi:hypothetical protein
MAEAEGSWEAEGLEEAAVLAATREAPVETQGAWEAAAEAREHRAVRERMAAGVPGGVLVAGLVERSHPVAA